MDGTSFRLNATDEVELRRISYQKVIKDPAASIQTVYGVTQDSAEGEIRTLFESCASKTGACITKEHIRHFKQRGDVPGCVIQRCSGKVYEDQIDL